MNSMEERHSRAKEYLGLVCNLYMTVILLALPLYMKDGYWQLGDAKYVLFRNVSLLCLLIWVLMVGLGLLPGSRKSSNLRKGLCQNWSWTDSFVLAYGAVNAFSYYFSDYRSTAWHGYVQWYMGLLSQLLFVWIYFFVSRQYDGSRFCLLAGQAALFVVALLGILNRLEMDPLGVLQGWVPKDWEYTHLLSTVGNINWLCGYISVLLPFSLIGFLYSRNRLQSVCLYIVSLLTIILLCVQCSGSGLLILGAAAVGMFLLGLSRLADFRRILLLGIGSAAVLPVLTVIFERQEWRTFPWEDLWCRLLVSWSGWPAVVLVLLLLYLLSFKLTFSKLRLFSVSAVGLVCLIALVVIVFPMLREAVIDYSWGNGRGALWTLALKAFWQGDVQQKLLGVGPDCYGEYVYASFPVQNYLMQEGPFENAIFTNAHNEWLNQLVNTGILGMVSYIGIFVSAVLRYFRGAKKDAFLYLGVLVLVLYAVNATVSFQQVMNAPFLFLALGVCENRRRAPEELNSNNKSLGD